MSAAWQFFKEIFRPNPSDSPVVRTTEKYAGFTRNDWSRVALDLTYNIGGFGTTVEQCERNIESITALRNKYDNLFPLELRKEVLHWLDFYESRAKHSLADCRKDERANDLRRYLRQDGYLS